MKSRAITIGILAIVAGVLIGWDILVAANDAPGDTISEVIRDISTRFLGVAYAFGGLMGHFFLNRERMPGPWLYWFGFTVFVSSAGALIWFYELATLLFAGHNAFAFAAGVVAGSALWPQEKI